MSNKTILELQDGHVSVLTKKDSLTSQKNISYDSLSNVFSNKSDVESPFLPGEYGLQKYSVRGNREYYMYLEKPKVVTCKYEISSSEAPDEDDFDDYNDYLEAYSEWEDSDGNYQVNKFVAPILVIFVSLTKSSNGTYSVNDSEMHALKTPIYTGNEVIYRAPFSNIYDHGRICWGDNRVSVPTIKSIQGLSTLFFGSPFNSDLDGGRFVQFQRSYMQGNAHKTLHFQMEVDAMLKDDTKTLDDVLTFVNSQMRNMDVTITKAFETFIRRG